MGGGVKNVPCGFRVCLLSNLLNHIKWGCRREGVWEGERCITEREREKGLGRGEREGAVRWIEIEISGRGLIAQEADQSMQQNYMSSGWTILVLSYWRSIRGKVGVILRCMFLFMCVCVYAERETLAHSLYSGIGQFLEKTACLAKCWSFERNIFCALLHLILDNTAVWYLLFVVQSQVKNGNWNH